MDGMVEGQAAQRRWRRLVQVRLAETRRLWPDADPGRPAYWNGRARRFAAQVLAARPDPVVTHARRAVRRGETVLDVGSGAGRLALAVAPRAAEVTAVDQSGRPLELLRAEARRRGLGNVRCVEARWEEADVEPADVVVCAYVLPLVADAGRFLRKLDGAARRRAHVYVNGCGFDLALDPFWRHFHGRRRTPAPSWLDAMGVLAELGIKPDVEVLEVPLTVRYRDLPAAVRSYRDQLALPDTAEVRRELRRLLGPWLVPREGGLAPPIRTMPAMALSWGPRR